MLRIAAYCRVSTNKEDQLDSLENQKEFFEDYAKKSNFDLIKVYADEGISGTSLKKRDELVKLLNDAPEHIFDMVVVKDISRLARNAVDFLNSIRKLKSNGIQCKFITSNLSTEDGELVLGMLSLVAQEESSNLSKRVKFGKRLNAQKGRVPNKIYGYDRINNFTLEINEREAEVIRLIFNLYIQDGYGIRKICSELMRRGITTRNGFIWYAKTVTRIISNPIYCGIYENNKWEIIDVIEKKKIRKPKEEYFIHMRPEWKIISKEIFEKAQKILNQRREDYKNTNEETGKRYSNKYLFSNLIKCKTCGASFIRKRYKYNNERIYWKCRTHDQLSSFVCKNASTIEENELLEIIRKTVTKDLNETELINLSKKRFLIIYNKDFRNDELQRYKKEHIRLEQYISKYKSMYFNGIVSIEELTPKIQGANDRLNELNNLIGNLEVNSSKERYNALVEQVTQGVLAFENLTNEELRILISKIEVDEKGNATIFFHNH